MRVAPVVLVLVAAICMMVFRDEIVKRGHTAWFDILLQDEFGLTQDMINKDKRYIGGMMGGVPNGFTEQPLKHDPEDDKLTRICRLSLYTKWAEELWSGVIVNSMTDPLVTLPPEQRVNAYLQTCRQILEQMPPEDRQRQLLESLDPVPDPSQFHVNITHPWMNGHYTETMQKHHQQWFKPGADVKPFKVDPDTMTQPWFQNRLKEIDRVSGFEHRLKPNNELTHIFPEELAKLGIRPVKDEWVEPSQIPDALLQGKTAVFDATKVCGKEIFNLTVPDIAKLHGDDAHRIPTFRLHSSGIGDGAWETLAELGQRFAFWRDRGWMNFPDFGPFPNAEDVMVAMKKAAPTSPLVRLALRFKWLLDGRPPWSQYLDHHVSIIRSYFQNIAQTTINVKRLSKFPLGDMPQAMGNPGWIQRFWNLLWIGPVSDFWHFDEWDNVLIAVSGNIYVAVMEQNATSLISGTRNVGLGWNDMQGFFKRDGTWVKENEWIKKIPIHILKLEPGMGITVPSRTYHNVMALDGNRILLNCFLVPKFGTKAMANNPNHHVSGFQSERHNAVGDLKIQTVGRLWDTMKIGGFFSGLKLEYL